MKMLILDKPKWKVSFRVMSCYPTDVWQLGLAAAPAIHPHYFFASL
jgi:hypothetical protein